jgi:sigma-B regulation protein RsbU (phosphoserine phosphatase)
MGDRCANAAEHNKANQASFILSKIAAGRNLYSLCRNESRAGNETRRVHDKPSVSYRIRCAEIWGGVKALSQDVSTAGVDASLCSLPGEGAKGGDVYYFSVCSYDRLTRVALADMRGHGERVSELSEWLYGSLQDRMNSRDGAGVLSELNTMVHARGFQALTTAAVLTYLNGGRLTYSYAGHPPALVSRGGGPWEPLPLTAPPGVANLPLGAFPRTRYDQSRVELRRGDRLFLYTDGVLECPGPGGSFLDEHRLIAALNRSSGGDLPAIRDAVLRTLNEFAGRPLDHDDCTFMAIGIRE